MHTSVHILVSHTTQFIACVQVPEDKLPQYKEFLKPLLDFGNIPPIHTTEFKDGRRIPTLVDLLDEVSFLFTYFATSRVAKKWTTKCVEVHTIKLTCFSWCRLNQTHTFSARSGTRTRWDFCACAWGSLHELRKHPRLQEYSGLPA